MTPPKGIAPELKKLQKKRKAMSRKAFFARLHKEILQKPSPRNENQVSTREMLEKQELEECKFKPELSKNTQEIANEVKEKRQINRIDKLLYEDAIKRKERKKMLEQNVFFSTRIHKKKLNDIKKEATKSNVTLNSYKKVREKLVKDLKTAMDYINQNSKSDYITSEALGEFLHIIGIYKILFNPAYKIQLDSNGNLITSDDRFKSKKFEKRLNRELEHHVQFWQILNRAKLPMIDSKLALDIVLLLYDLGSNPPEELATSIEQLLDTAYKEYKLNEPPRDLISPKTNSKEKWTYLKLVKEFKKLNEAKYTAETCNFLKSHGIIQEAEETFTFKPQINEVSKTLDEMHTGKYISQMTSKYESEEFGAEQKVENINSLKAFETQSEHQSSNMSSKTDVNTRIMIMYEKQKAKDEKLKVERARKKLEELKDCTFKPVLHTKTTKNEDSIKIDFSNQVYFFSLLILI